MTKTTRILLFSITLATIMVLMPITATATVSPDTYADIIPSGGSMDIIKNVTTGQIPANPDIYFLTDSTSSMLGTIEQVKEEMKRILDNITDIDSSAKFAVGEYRDEGEDFVHRTNRVMTINQALIQTAINAIVTDGGEDIPEANFFALEQVATDGDIGFDPNTSNIIVWFGDAPGHETPVRDADQATATAALIKGGFTVIAVDTGSESPSGGLDATGQATDITEATGGILTSITAFDADEAVLNAIQAQTTTITPELGESCDDELDIIFSPLRHTGVDENESVDFTETVSVSLGALPGIYQCTVDFLDSSGASLGTQTVTITVPNPPPNAVDDSIILDEDTSISFDPKTNDSDPDEDPLTITAVGTASHGTVTTDGDTIRYTPDADYNGSDSFIYTIGDGEGGFDTATVNVTVQPVNDAPVCNDATGDTDLWPPKHKMVSLDISLDVTDVDGDVLTIGVTSIFQDEPTNGLGDGDQSPDGEITTDGTAKVRAERSGLDDGRVYVITITASDGEFSCSETVKVGVPHDKKDTAVNSGATFDSTVS